jgi:hypothetical protein
MSVSGFPPGPIRPIVHEVSTLLKERKETVSVAETVGLSSAYTIIPPL